MPYNDDDFITQIQRIPELKGTLKEHHRFLCLIRDCSTGAFPLPEKETRRNRNKQEAQHLKNSENLMVQLIKELKLLHPTTLGTIGADVDTIEINHLCRFKGKLAEKAKEFEAAGYRDLILADLWYGWLLFLEQFPLGKKGRTTFYAFCAIIFEELGIEGSDESAIKQAMKRLKAKGKIQTY